MNTATQTITHGVTVQAEDHGHEQMGKCAMSGCTRTERDAAHARTRWTTVRGSVVAHSGITLPTDWAETCQDHEPDAAAAVAAVLATYGAPWRVEATMDDYAADEFRAAQVVSQS